MISSSARSAPAAFIACRIDSRSIGVAPSVPGFLAQVKVLDEAPDFFAGLYTYAWFVGFALAALAYVIGTRLAPARRSSSATSG